jgi:hypothetical protein
MLKYIVSYIYIYNSAVLDTPQKRFFKLFNLNNFEKIIFFSKIHSKHESGSQMEPFDEKIWR